MTDDLEFSAPILGGSHHGKTYYGRGPILRLPKKEKTSARFDPGAGGPEASHFEAETYRLTTFTGPRACPRQVEQAWLLYGTPFAEAMALAKAHFGWDE